MKRTSVILAAALCGCMSYNLPDFRRNGVSREIVVPGTVRDVVACTAQVAQENPPHTLDTGITTAAVGRDGTSGSIINKSAGDIHAIVWAVTFSSADAGHTRAVMTLNSTNPTKEEDFAAMERMVSGCAAR